MLLIFGIILAVILIGTGGFFAFITHQINQIPKMTFKDMLSYTTKNNDKALITVGIIQNGEARYTLYGKDGAILPQTEHIYEIGSISKTFTASLLFKAIDEGKIRLDDTIDKYLDLPAKDYYPPIKRLITHTSGYKKHYLEKPMVSNFFAGKNSFYRVPTEMLIERIGKIDLKDRDYKFVYSNFGISVVGAVLSKVYETDYATLINEYVQRDLDLNQTRIANGPGDLNDYWTWAENDAYMPAGALLSTIGDMMKYAQNHMQRLPSYLSDTHRILAEINATPANYMKMNIHMDSIGAAWVMDATNSIVWHNGGTSNFNTYLGFDVDKQIAVVVLSNLSPDYRIPATVMGIKLLTHMQTEKQ